MFPKYVTKQWCKSQIKTWLREVMEALLPILIVVYMNSKIEFTVKKVLGISILVGTITFFLEKYNPDYNSNVKMGMYSSISSKSIG